MKISVGMSGGVDSTIAAYILKKQGHEVIGVNFDFLNMNSNGEPDKDLLEISEKLGIKIISRNFSSEFNDRVIWHFVNDYENGITPNPCALCNAVMKFDALLHIMRDENADMVATGHYANVVKLNNGVEKPVDIEELKEREKSNFIIDEKTRFCIKKSGNSQKDQSYMLYRLTQEELSHIIFPIANMDKNDVRKLAKELDLKVADKKDSQDVCFIKNDLSSNLVNDTDKNIDNQRKKYVEFIKEFELGKDYKERIAKGELNLSEIDKFPFFRKGEFIDEKGTVLGYHNGIINYTIGQRKGLNIAFGERRFVKAINIEKNQVVLSTNESLMSTDFKIYDIVFSGKANDELQNKCSYIAKLRYRHEGTLCEVDFSSFDYEKQEKNTVSIENAAICHLINPVRAITNGQAAVFYDDEDRIMFGGRIACE